MPDLIVERGQIRSVSPIDIAAGSGGQYALNETARSWTTLWLTMKALGWSARTAISPSSLPVRVSFKHGRGSFLSTLIPNPRFYEMIMVWPIGWTAPEGQVTEFPAWLRRSRGLFSRLLTEFPSSATAE
ncbi:MAG: hypothetical protein ABIO86_17235 [Sphingomonas sp.]